jgi:hypothetical protein
MVDYLRGKAGDRKLRLFAVACCRRIAPVVRDGRSEAALGVAERFADGLATDVERSAARKVAQQAAQVRGVTPRPTAPRWERRAASAVYCATARDAMEAAWNARQFVVEALVWRAGGYVEGDARSVEHGEQGPQAALVREIIGNPFRPVAFDPRWRSSDVLGLAHGIYTDRAFDRLPVLADALMDAGCADEDILAHCRGAGPHVRGCWVVDLVLGRE